MTTWKRQVPTALSLTALQDDLVGMLSEEMVKIDGKKPYHFP